MLYKKWSNFLHEIVVIFICNLQKGFDVILINCVIKENFNACFKKTRSCFHLNLQKKLLFYAEISVCFCFLIQKPPKNNRTLNSLIEGTFFFISHQHGNRRLCTCWIRTVLSFSRTTIKFYDKKKNVFNMFFFLNQTKHYFRCHLCCCKIYTYLITIFYQIIFFVEGLSEWNSWCSIRTHGLVSTYSMAPNITTKYWCWFVNVSVGRIFLVLVIVLI